VETGGTAIDGETGETFETPQLEVTTSYYVAIVSSFGTCESTRTEVIASIELPDPPTANGASTCTPAVLTLSANGGAVGDYRWYTVETGGTPVSGATGETFETPELNATTSYYVALVSSFDDACESERTEVVASFDRPDPPTVVGASSCTPAALILTANGGSAGQYRWYTQEDGGSSLEDSKTFLTPEVSETTTYYVAVNNGICESNRIEVTATIGGADCTPVDPLPFTLEIFNAVSPNKDGKNDVFFIRNIDVSADAMKNHVTIFNRWGDVVWEGNDYNNTTVAFTGLSKNNTELPSGTYYYTVEFSSGKKPETGYISLKR
jgi:gliding motility-associated-like protein